MRGTKAVLMSIQARHNRNIESGAKVSELRTKPPKLKPPFKVYTYESGFDGRHKVVNEWICKSITEWRICMGIPAHLPKRACVEPWEIREYSGKDCKNISEMEISDLVVYAEPKDLSEFFVPCRVSCESCKNPAYFENGCAEKGCKAIRRPPQNWCYAEEI